MGIYIYFFYMTVLSFGSEGQIRWGRLTVFLGSWICFPYIYIFFLSIRSIYKCSCRHYVVGFFLLMEYVITVFKDLLCMYVEKEFKEAKKRIIFLDFLLQNCWCTFFLHIYTHVWFFLAHVKFCWTYFSYVLNFILCNIK